MSRPNQKRKESWLSIEWDDPNGKPKPPSALHGVLDQIAGSLLRDEKLVRQGKRELRHASEYKNALRDARTRRGYRQNSNTTTTRNVGKSTSASTSDTPGFWGALFGMKKPEPVHHSTARYPTPKRTLSTGRETRVADAYERRRPSRQSTRQSSRREDYHHDRRR